MDKFQNRYRIPSARLQMWDYRWGATYFVTICTEGREHYFGQINNIDNSMQLSNMGIIADVLWHEISNHSKNVELGSFIVMPNHIHGILILPETVNTRHDNVETGHALSDNLTSDNNTYSKSSPPAKTIGQSRFQNIGKKSLSSIVGSYKSAVTKHANRLGIDFAWQSRFHDHIIRTNKAHQRITDYIDTNIENWEKDKFYEP